MRKFIIAKRFEIDILFFILALMLGVLSMIITKILHLPQIITTTIPVSIIILYFFTILLSKRLNLRFDQAGDNIYYLGFLYTLCSLALALIEFNSDNGAEYIITNFGIALFTTIVGLCGRVIFNQMRKDPIETERQSRIELAEAANILKTELYHSAIEFNSFRRILQQNLTESFDEMKLMMNDFTRTIISDHKEIILKILSEIQDNFNEHAQTIFKISNKIELVSASLETLRHKIDSIDVPNDLVINKFSPAFESVNELTNSLNLINTALSFAINNIPHIKDKLNDLFNNISANADISKNLFSSTAEPIIQNIKLLSDSVKDTSSILNSFKLVLSEIIAYFDNNRFIFSDTDAGQ